MSANRKLLTEIDRTLKKVEEGVEIFDEIWEKVHSATQQNQKEKYEVDLKKEIKKLQRHRDQIKTWVASSDIKDKRALTEARKLIETKMEQFKVCEKETKTKTYSKEGLARETKIDPHEAAKHSTRDWLSEKVDALMLQIDMHEADMEKLTSGKGSKKNKHEIDALEGSIKRHRWHIAKLEQITRLLDNDALAHESVIEIKEDVEYYIDANQEPDFMDAYDETMDIFESLDLGDVPEEEVAVVEEPTKKVEEKKEKKKKSTAEEKKDKKEKKEKKDKKGVPPAVPLTIGRATVAKNLPAGSAAPAAPAAPVAPGGGAPKKTATPGVPTPVNVVPAQVPASESLANIILKQQKPTTTTAAVGGGVVAEAAAAGPLMPQQQQQQQQQRPPAVVVPQAPPPPPGTTAAQRLASTTGGVVPKQQQQPLGAQQQQQPLVVNTLTGGGPPVVVPQQQQQQQQTPPRPPYPGVVVATQQQPQPPQQQQQQQQPQPPPQQQPFAGGSPLRVPPGSPLSRVVSNPPSPAPGVVALPSPKLPPSTPPPTQKPTTTTLPPMPQVSVDQQQQQQQQPLVVAAAAAGGKASQKRRPARRPVSTTPFGPGASLEALLDLQDRAAADDTYVRLRDAKLRQNDFHEVVPADDDDRDVALAELASSQRTAPKRPDAERPRQYVPRNPYNTPAAFPATPHHVFDDPRVFDKLTTDTLFFIFYYQQGTYQQYLAARELKKQSWRYHKKYMTWFQRHEEPKVTTDEFEQGTYVYFDYETGWCQRIKADFTFEYNFLEDELVA